MYSAEFSAVSAELEALRAYLRSASSIRLALSIARDQSEPTLLENLLFEASALAPDPVRLRIMDHILVVSRLYSVYEAYCENAVANWIDFLSKSYPFSKLPPKLHESYKAGFTTVLSMLPSQRFPLLTVDELVKNYHNALSGSAEYTLNAECVTFHKNNLRWSELCELFGRASIEGIGRWVSLSQRMVSYFDGNPERISDQLSSKLDKLVQYRNDCSHGLVDIDEILGPDELLDLITFVWVLCTTLRDFFESNAFEKLHELGRLREIGIVSEVFAKAGAVVILSKGGRISTGQKVVLAGRLGFFGAEITSIQIEGRSEVTVESAAGQEVGLKLDALPRQNSRIFAILD